LSSVNASWIKLLAISEDDGHIAHFCTNLTVNLSGIARNGNVCTATSTAHGLSAGDVVVIAGTTENAYNRVATVITVPDADHFTFESYSGGEVTQGTVSRIVTAGNAATSVVISAPTVDTSIAVNEERGIAASSVGGAQPGFQFYACVYNRSGGGHVGNRIKIGGRLKTTNRTNVRISGLPNLSGEDAEWELLIGRTGDGAEVPYAIADSAFAWHSVLSGQTATAITEAAIDGDSELPTRNGLPPADVDKAWRVGDRICAAANGKPTLWRSGSEQESRLGRFVGCPEQAWAADDIETFPTAQAITCGAAYNYDSWLFTLNDMAVLTDLSGVLGWQGPWNFGCAGPNAFTLGWKGLPYWVTGEKQLATMTAEGPAVVSDEYEAALLSRIGDAYLGETETVYYRHAKKQIDQLRIKGRDASGAPFTVIHDFTLRDDRSPYGQAYEAVYAGPLAANYTQALIRDGMNRLQVCAGAGDGCIYQLYTGDNDAGSEFTADYAQLLYAGPLRSAIKRNEWWGDANLEWYLADALDTPAQVDQMKMLSDTVARPVPGEEHNSHYVVDLDSPQITHAYLWIRLVSHSADGTTELNSPPHFPLETYGRVYASMPLVGPSRGAV
jgi:hypothetical protein